MNAARRKVLVFGLQFLPPFLGFVWIYPLVLPIYRRAVLAVANVALALLEAPLEANHLGGERESGALFLNIIVLPALLLATPVTLRVRLRLFATGLLVLFCLHVFTVVVYVSAIGRIADPKNSFLIDVVGALRLGGAGLAFALWGLLTWQHWFSEELP